MAGYDLVDTEAHFKMGLTNFTIISYGSSSIDICIYVLFWSRDLGTLDLYALFISQCRLGNRTIFGKQFVYFKTTRKQCYALKF